MDLSKIRAAIVDDDIFKATDIRKALEFCRITDIVTVSDQEALWGMIDQNEDEAKKPDLIVTDVHYPLKAGEAADEEAGFKLIERLEREKIGIPVIVCSSKNYLVPEALGSVWYNPLKDLESGFKEVLKKLEEQEQ